MSQYQIDFVTPHSVDKLIKPAADALAAKGFTVNHHATTDAFVAAGGGANSDIIVAVQNRIPTEIVRNAPKLRAVVSPVTGTDSFDEKVASECGVIVSNGQVEENYISMAESAVLMVLAALYDFNGTQRMLRENQPRPGSMKARMLMKKRVGMIGFGQIAQTMARLLSTWNIDMTVNVRTPRDLPSYVRAVSLEETMRGSDVIVCLAALNNETRGMLTPYLLQTMKHDVTFVNVSRGGIVADDDLARLAVERPDMRLALDVFDPEPLRPDSPLRDLPNAILTPHMVGHTRETHERLPVVLLENIENALAGRLPDYVRNRDIAEGWLRKWGH